MIKLYWSILFLGGIFLFSCKTEEAEIIDISDVIPESKYNDQVQSDSIEKDTITAVINEFKKFGAEVSSLAYATQRDFPDRFGPEHSEKFWLTIKEDSILYSRWVYEDSIKTMNAFYNWMDCFGKKCKSFYIGEEKNLRPESVKIMVNDSALIYIQSDSKIDFNFWNTFHENKGYAPDWNYILEQGRHGRVRWFTFVDEEQVKYEK